MGKEVRGGRLWLPTSVGLMMIDPNRIEKNNPITWIYIFVLLFILLAAFVLYHIRVRLLKARERELSALVRHLTVESQEQSGKFEELDKTKSRFFANISHEFRTPLTLIMGPLEQILSAKPGKEMEAKAHLMLRSSRRLLNLINQLLDLAKFESGKMSLDASLQDIVSFVRSIVMCFESLAGQKKVRLIFQGQEDHIPVYFDADKLEKIIINLLANAFNYTPEGGEIGVLVDKGDAAGGFPAGCVEIVVRDNGAGIPGDELPYIFDRFYRGKGSHGYDRKGAGIGLSLSKDLVELHHGDIRVRSSCGDDRNRGTEFTLRLPLGKEHLQPGDIVSHGETCQSPIFQEPCQPSPAINLTEHFNGAVSPAGNTADEGKIKEESPIILVVEDNADVRTYIRGSFEPGFKVVEAVDGRQGVDLGREIIPDLIICDIKMPGMDGYEVCRTLKSDILTGHIPIIILTARVEEESVLRGLKAGADDYITKPFSSTLLAARVMNLINLRRQMQLERKNRTRFLPVEITVSPLDDEFYKKLQETVEMHLSDPDFNVEALSRVLEMSQATLYRKVQALTGKTPTSFISSYRLKRAAQLLEVYAGNIYEVAGKVGFLDKSYFARCFKEQFHCLPSGVQASDKAGPIEEDEMSQEFLREKEGAGILEKAPPGHRMQEIILLVEDSDEFRRFLRASLEPGYYVIEAADGGEGLARAMEIVPDLVISDIMMPGMDGYELCRVLKNDIRTSHVPIILLTAKASEDSIILGLETGADDYIVKPFNLKILHTRIENLIRLRGHLQDDRDREMVLLPVKLSEGELDSEFMKELDTVIDKNMEDTGFNVEHLAEKLYMNRVTLYRKILAITGEGPAEYIRSQRLKRAAQLLESNFGDVTAVAMEVGFSSSSYFAKCFKEVFHRSPSDYRASMRK